MLKRVLCLVLCLSLCLMAVGCSLGKGGNLSVDEGDDIDTASTIKEEKPKIVANPLTGVVNMDPEKANDRPVAFSVNNIHVAQTVQTGLNEADIVYETEVEGGITRLIAVFQDISKVAKIGTVRSARYAFVDLAMGHNAIYVHHGQDEYHAGPHLKDIDHFTVSENAGGARVKNGLATEHTLYAYGDKTWECLESKFNTENKNVKSWVNFEEDGKDVTLENAATSVSVAFSPSYKTVFNYDVASKKYTRYFGSEIRKDYVTGENIQFKNVFVLFTTIRTYPNCTDGKNHREVMLQSGDGYYFVNGTYTPIKWSKGAAANGFKFTTADGTELTVNTGNSWVCIADKSSPVAFQ